MNHPSATPPRAFILCTDGRLSRLLETELTYLGIDARAMESLPASNEELCLLIADGDTFDPTACATRAHACGCPLLIFGRERLDPPSLPAEAVFLRRPFALRELEQMVRSLLSELPARGIPMGLSRARAVPAASPASPSHAPTLTVENGAVTLDGKTVSLTPAEQTILEYLCARRGETVPRAELAALLGGGGNSVEVYVCHLRTKLEKPLGRRMIRTVRGVGYRLDV